MACTGEGVLLLNLAPCVSSRPPHCGDGHKQDGRGKDNWEGMVNRRREGSLERVWLGGGDLKGTPLALQTS